MNEKGKILTMVRNAYNGQKCLQWSEILTMVRKIYTSQNAYNSQKFLQKSEMLTMVRNALQMLQLIKVKRSFKVKKVAV